MIGALREFGDRMLGRGEASITIPIFDGALKPNQILEHAETVGEFKEAADIAADGGSLLIADGTRVLRSDAGGPREAAHFEHRVTALCAVSGGGVAVVLDGRELRVKGGPLDGFTSTGPANAPFHAVNAVTCLSDGALAVTDGSLREDCDHWVHDLMGRGASGRLIVVEPATGQARELARGLEYAFGACPSDGDILVSESWRHRLLAVGSNGRRRPLLTRLPVYPSRIVAASGGGFWLTAFTARTQLVEFVLRENAFRRRMMKEIAPEHWIAPRLRSGESYLEPMQGAHLRTMGVLKPWAPPRSYGLVVRLSATGQPVYSLHSRVDGTNHGVVAAAEVGDSLYLLAKGPGRLLRLAVADIEKELAP
jgi:sugar lactone lactonase YvrE